MYYSDEILDLVRSANDIVDVIGKNVQLKKSGSRYVGLCPFHNEKTPSFSVDPRKQLFYCFGCHKGGTVFTFVQEYNSMTFTEAVQALAQNAGISLPERSESREEKHQRDVRQQLLDINRMAAGYYYYMLRSPQGKPGMEYLKKRELSAETMHAFGLGFAPATSDGLYQHLKKKGISDDLLRQSGLMNVDERRGKMYDKFWNRVIFPIMDQNDRVIGFGGRVMGDGKPKYLNSPQTLVFDKSRNLYGLNVARKSRENKIILCEGYMDVIAMHQAGFTYAVASLGTALTRQHCSILRRFTKNVILSYDSDNAGVNAAMRAIPMLRQAGINPSILRLEPYKDPDEFMKALGHDEFQKRIDSAENAFLFETRIMQRSYDMADPDQAADFYDALAGLIASFDDVFKRKGYISMAARQYGIEERDLTDRVVSKLQTGAMDPRYQARPDAARASDPRYQARPDAARASNRTDEREDENYDPALLYGDPGAYEEADYYEDPATGGFYQEPKAAARRSPMGSVIEQGTENSRQLLLNYIVQYPALYPDVRQYIGPEDYGDGFSGKIAELVYAQMDASGKVDEAKIISHFETAEDQNRAAALFHTMDRADNASERGKAVREVMRKVLQAAPLRQGEGGSMLELTIRRQQALKKIGTMPVHLS